MRALLVVLLVVWVVVAVLGAVVEGLFWLTVIGLVLLAVTALVGWSRLRRAVGQRPGR